MPEENKDASPEQVAGESLVRRISDALAAGDSQQARLLALDLRAPDLADLIELLEPDERVGLIQVLGKEFNFDVLSEVDETVRDQLSEALPNELLARAVTELDTDDAVYLLESLEEEDKAEILAQIPGSDRVALLRSLDYPEETAGRLMQSDFFAVSPLWTVGRVIEHARQADDLPDTFTEIFVVDPAFRVMGSVDLSHLLRSGREVPIRDIMATDREVIRATADQEEVAQRFRRYDLIAAPVVDDSMRLVGVITVDDVVELIQQKADEDILALGGVGDETVADSVLASVRSRMPWLLVNLATAMLASLVIKQFDATIEQLVALAVLMPIVASMGGNAGIQTMTITVRALALHKLTRDNMRRVVNRETLVAIFNGLVLAVLLSAIVLVWFGSGALGLVIATALIINILVAGLAGILIPLTLDHFELDPAPASGVMLTTVTDVVGFFAFLGLASLWLL